MNASGPEQRISDYLDRVSAQLGDTPEQERSEILSDLDAHIRDAVGGDVLSASEADVLNVLERLGNPSEVAREARGVRGHYQQTPPSSNPYWAEQRKTPGALEVGAIVLTALFWPIGLLLAWVSARWKTRDKAIATVFPLASGLILLALAIAGAVGYSTSGESVSVVSEQPESGSSAPQDPAQTEPRSPAEISEPSDGSGIGSRFLAVVGFLLGVIAGPFIGAVYLAVKLQPRDAPTHSDQSWDNGVPVRT
ncbi:MAG: hypothetical protein EA415_12135 [Sphaerobacteraceae bacterium]|nr:MAG: hypothetical protein EA415_12135 [Sphaerobacteraceae bacterium]